MPKFLVLAVMLLSGNVYALNCESLVDKNLGAAVNHFFDFNNDGSLKVLRDNVNKRSGSYQEINTSESSNRKQKVSKGQIVGIGDDSNTEVYEAKVLDFGQNIKKEDLIKNEAFVDKYLMGKETLVVQYFQNEGAFHKPAAIDYIYTTADNKKKRVKFYFQQYSSPGNDKSCQITHFETHMDEDFKINSKEVRIPSGVYDHLKCAQFNNYLNMQADLVACMNTAEKMLSLKKQLLAAQGEKEMSVNDEKKFAKEYKKGIFDTFKTIEDAVKFNLGCEKFFSKKDMENSLNEYNASLSAKPTSNQISGSASR